MPDEAAIEQYERENIILKEQIEKRTGKSTEQLYEEREKRTRDAIELKEPDRVPLSVTIDTQIYTGVPNSAAYYDPIAFKRAMRKITVDFEPDMCNTGLPTSGAALEVLGVTNRMWPGGPLPADAEYQFIESEFMKEDEYDMFLYDPSGFMIRRFLPRMYRTLLPLADLPPLDTMFRFEGLTTLFTKPEFVQLAKKIYEAGQQLEDFRNVIGDSYEELAQLGFPAFAPVTTGGVGGAPFDTVSSYLRGMKGSMLDMYRQPEKLLQACDMILQRRIAQAVPADPTKRGNPKKIGMPLWRGDKSFMSEEQFNRFYWPGLKKALQATIDLGYVPVPFFEDEFGDRLECLLELPKGKIIASVEYMDAVRAKEILNSHSCILVRGPLSTRVWSLREVEACFKELIDKCGKGGGMLLAIRLPDNTRTEDGRGMIESINEYSRY
jgi:hypothetical protein